MRFLFVDRILQLIPGKSIQGIKHVTRDDACLCADEKGNLAFIPSFIGETLGQLAAWNVMFTNGFTRRPVAGIVDSAQLYRPAYVGETLLLESSIDNLDDQAVQYHSQATINDELVFCIEGALGPLLPMENFIAEDEVKRQFAEINRPGDWSPLLAAIGNETVPVKNHPTLPLTFDRIIDGKVGESMVAEKYITRTAPWFSDHFPYKPVLPMTVLLECKMNLAKMFIARAGYPFPYQIKALRKIKMNDFVQPGDIVRCTVKSKMQNDNELILTFRSEVEGKRVCVLDMYFTRT